MATVTITGLQRAAEVYQKDFKVLPFAVLMTAIQSLRLRLMKVNNKDILIEQQRKGGISAPYEANGTNSVNENAIMKLAEKSLEVLPSFCALKDHIMNYKEKQVLWDPVANTFDNKTKKHPLEKEIIGAKIKTVAEDIIDALFPAARDTSDKTPYGMFDGYDTLIDAAIAGGEIGGAKGNYVDAGTLTAPVDEDDVDSWNHLVAWIRNAHRRFAPNAVLRMPIDIYNNCRDALENKLKYKDIERNIFVERLRDMTNMSNLTLIVHEALGTGDRITLAEDGLFDFGMNTPGDEAFVQIRQFYEDPNFVQFWLQFEAGCRINSWHEKVFMVNAGTPTANQLSGDYLS